MLAICSDVEAWKEKKASEEANAYYNEMLNNGFKGEWGENTLQIITVHLGIASDFGRTYIFCGKYQMQAL